ncbi:MAG: argininosuccinate lyase [Chitinophagaceae bacterium]|nr:argininosuccinate lyase [Chitinophagaceae bacterium]
MKLWAKNTTKTAAAVESFTVGRDREMDLFLAPFDVLGSIAHVQMLTSIQLLREEEGTALMNELRTIYQEMQGQELKLPAEVEDIHSYIEIILTQRLGDIGKKIHAARSRNDQVLLDIRLFMRHELEQIVESTSALFELLQQQSERYKYQLIPGYTHLQLAMPSSFGLWFGAYAESLVDDLITLEAAYRVVNKNPLGSAAGFGSSFPINRTMTTQLLGFDALNFNVVYAQMGRGKTERIIAAALANLADTMARMSMDACLFLNQQFDFISFPSELTTGSSIMPHKKNPDVFELIRAHGNRLRALPNEITMLTTNLPSGYHRDLQLLKEHLFPAFQTIKDCMQMLGLMLTNIEVRDNILDEDKYKFVFSVEEVNRLVQQGVPFREAYQQIGKDIADGSFHPFRTIQHTHEGSIGQLCNDKIREQMQQVLAKFPFERVNNCLRALAGNP